MTDLDPETRVWHIPRAKTNGLDSVVHTQSGCTQLAKADRVLGPKQVKQLQKDWDVCDYCSDNLATGGGEKELYLKLADEDFQPDEGQSLAEFADEVQS